MVRGRLIGIGGLLHAGKDAVSDYLVGEHGWRKLGMSDTLNEALLQMNPYIPLAMMEDPSGDGSVIGKFLPYRDLHDRHGYVDAKKFEEVRRLLQELGTGVGRNMIDTNVWVDMAVRKFDALRDAGFDVIVTGMRYPNELEAVREAGGELWWVSRPGNEGGSSLTAAHTSENSVQPEEFDVLIINDGTLMDLYRRVETALEKKISENT